MRAAISAKLLWATGQVWGEKGRGKKKGLPGERETNRPFIKASLQRFMAFHARGEESLGTLEGGSELTTARVLNSPAV